MGILDWLFGGRKRRVRRDMQRAGITFEEAYCDTCNTWYRTDILAQVNRHAH